MIIDDNTICSNLLNEFISYNDISCDLNNTCLINKDNIFIFKKDEFLYCIDLKQLFNKLNEKDDDIKKKQCTFIKQINADFDFLIDNRNKFLKKDKNGNLYFYFSIDQMFSSKIDVKNNEQCFLISFKKYPILNECTRIMTQLGENNKFLAIISKMPKKLERYDARLFYNNEQIVNIQIPNNIIKIEKEVFKNCVNLEKIQFSDSITTINDGAFQNCSKLKEIDLSNTKIDDLNEDVFNGCINLEYVKLPKTIKSVNRNSFYNCNKLTVIDCTESIHPIAFLLEKNNQLPDALKIIIPDYLYIDQYLGSEAFIKKHLVKQSLYKSLQQ